MSSDPAWEKQSLRFLVKRHFTKYYHWVFGGAALWRAPQVLTLAVHAGCCFLLTFLIQDTHCWHHNSTAAAGRKMKRLSPPATASLDCLEAGPASRPCLGWLRFMTWQDGHLWNLDLQYLRNIFIWEQRPQDTISLALRWKICTSFNMFHSISN